MNHKDENGWDRDFYDLGEIYSPKSLHHLVKKIEEEGIWGHDRFGRKKKYLPDSEEVNAALDALAEQHQKERDGFVFGSDGPMDLVGLGWPTELILSDQTFEKDIQEISEKISTRSENNKLILIGALLEVLSGLATGNKHPDWGSKKDAFEHLELRKILQATYVKNDRKPIEPFGENTLSILLNQAVDELYQRINRQPKPLKDKNRKRSPNPS